MTLQHLVTREEATLIRAVAAGETPTGWSGRIYQPPSSDPVGEGRIEVVPASGRAACRECGETILGGEDAIVFGFDSLADVATPSFGARLARAYLHAAPCRDYPEEDT